MAKRKGSPVSREIASSKREREGMDESQGMVDHDAREVENAKRLDKLPQEVWEKILDELDENDLFPLALSCRHFRQKQKELVARTRQSGPESGKPRRALKTTFPRCPGKSQPASADYLRFCTKEKLSEDVGKKRNYETFQKAERIRCLAAFHGHLPLLWEILVSGNLGPDASWAIASHAARGGQLETLQWLKTRKGFKMIASLFLKISEDI